MPYRHDAHRYTTVPTRNPADTLSLTRALISAATGPQPPPLATRLAVLHELGVKLQDAWIEANRPSDGKAAQAADVSLDRAWSAFRSRLEDWVDVDHPEHGARARELLALILPTGLDFLNLRYAEQWAESDRRLVLIKQDGLEPELIDLIGKPFVAGLSEAHAEYGAALNITTDKDPKADALSIADALAALRTAIAGYGRLALGLTPDDDDAAIAATEDRLEPMIRYRRARASTSEGEAEAAPEPEPIDAPLPEPPQETE